MIELTVSKLPNTTVVLNSKTNLIALDNDGLGAKIVISKSENTIVDSPEFNTVIVKEVY